MRYSKALAIKISLNYYFLAIFCGVVTLEMQSRDTVELNVISMIGVLVQGFQLKYIKITW